MRSWDEIPRFTRPANYHVHQPWSRIVSWVEEHQADLNLDLDPDFQRAHVWDDYKRQRYVEFILREGQSSKVLFFNCPGWMGNWNGPFVLVDGKQRLEAVMRFMTNKLRIFPELTEDRSGLLHSDFEGRMPMHACFEVHVNNLKTRAEVLQWYLDLNDGGVVHTDEELARVRHMLQKEQGLPPGCGVIGRDI